MSDGRTRSDVKVPQSVCDTVPRQLSTRGCGSFIIAAARGKRVARSGFSTITPSHFRVEREGTCFLQGEPRFLPAWRIIPQQLSSIPTTPYFPSCRDGGKLVDKTFHWQIKLTGLGQQVEYEIYLFPYRASIAVRRDDRLTVRDSLMGLECSQRRFPARSSYLCPVSPQQEHFFRYNHSFLLFKVQFLSPSLTRSSAILDQCSAVWGV